MYSSSRTVFKGNAAAISLKWSSRCIQIRRIELEVHQGKQPLKSATNQQRQIEFFVNADFDSFYYLTWDLIRPEVGPGDSLLVTLSNKPKESTQDP
jgi:hypothetical protein